MFVTLVGDVQAILFSIHICPQEINSLMSLFPFAGEIMERIKLMWKYKHLRQGVTECYYLLEIREKPQGV